MKVSIWRRRTNSIHLDENKVTSLESNNWKWKKYIVKLSYLPIIFKGGRRRECFNFGSETWILKRMYKDVFCCYLLYHHKTPILFFCVFHFSLLLASYVVAPSAFWWKKTFHKQKSIYYHKHGFKNWLSPSWKRLGTSWVELPPDLCSNLFLEKRPQTHHFLRFSS